MISKETQRVIAILRDLSSKLDVRIRQAKSNQKSALERAEIDPENDRQTALERRIAARWQLEEAAGRRAIELLSACEKLAKEQEDVLRVSTS